MKRPLLQKISMLLLLAILPLSVLASESDDGQTSAYPTTDLQGTAQQGGTGSWNTATASITTRIITASAFTDLIIANIDRTDNTPEILLQDNETLSVIALDNSNNLVLRASTDVGSMIHESGGETHPTPSWAYHNTTWTKIITTNGSHVLEYDYDSSDDSLTLNASSTWLYGAGLAVTTYPKIVCSNNPARWLDADLHCFFAYYYRVGASQNLTYINYNINDSTLNQTLQASTITRSIGTNIQWHHTPKIGNIDADTDDDMTFMFVSTGITPADLYIDNCDINTNGGIVCNNVYTHNNAGTAQTDYTDVIIADINGVANDGQELTWGFSDDGTNFQVRTVNNAGTVLEADYFGKVTNDIEGDFASANMMLLPNCGVSLAGGSQVGMLVHDTGDEETTLACVSLYAGADSFQTTYTDASEFASRDLAIAAQSTGDSSMDIHYSNVLYDASANAVSTNVNITTAVKTVPVDMTITNSLDMVSFNTTRLWYYDDQVVNNNVELGTLTWSSCNAVCNNTKVVFTLDVEDDTNDFSTCFAEISYANGTKIENTTNKTGTPPQNFIFEYTFVESPEAYDVVFSCKDQFHDTYVTYSYNLWTGTIPKCCGFNEGGGSTVIVINQTQCSNGVDDDADGLIDLLDPGCSDAADNSEDTDQNTIDNSIDRTLGILFGTSERMKLIVGIGIIIGIMAFAAMYGIKNGMALIAVGLMATILVTMIGLISVYILILIIMGMAMVFFLGKAIMGGQQSGGGG